MSTKESMPHARTITVGANPSVVSDVTDDSSSKILTVPASTRYYVLTIHANFVTNASVGNRQLRIDFRDGSDNLLCSVPAGATQAASLTYEYTFAPGVVNSTAVIDAGTSGGVLTTPIPGTLILPATYDIRVYDAEAIDASGTAENLHVWALVDSVSDDFGSFA